MAFWNRGSGSDGEVVFNITADNTQAVDAINDTVKEMKRAGNDLTAAADTADNNISKSFTHAFNIERIKNWAIQAGKWLINFGKEAVEAASDLQEVQNVVDVTFGDSSSVIDAWAKNAITQFGLTEVQAKRFTSTLGAMAKSSGLAGDDIVQMSTDLAGLAADMASFYNLDFDTAFQKIRAGIAGETEPLKQLGINMSVANLQAYALTQGITKAFDKMSQGEQIMLRYQYMMQATADAQGDFARTSDGYANSMRLFENNIEQLKTTIGSVFIDQVGEAIGSLNRLFELLQGDLNNTVLDDFAAIDLKSAEKLTEIEKVYNEAKNLNDLLLEISDNLSLKKKKTESTDQEPENTEGKSIFSEEIAALLSLGVKSDEARRELEALGLSSEDIASAQTQWLDVCRRLVNTIPSLSKVIDKNTGEVKAGHDELLQYIEDWKALQETQVILSAIEEKRQALAADNRSDLRYVELRMAQMHLEDLKKQIESAGYTVNDALIRARNKPGIGASEEKKAFYELSKEYAQAISDVQIKQKAYTDAVDAHAQAEEYLNRVEKETIDQQAQLEDQLEDTAREMSIYERAAMGDADALGDIKDAVTEALEALQALEDYQQSVYSDVDRSVRQTINGFNEIVTPAQRAREELRDAKKELENLSAADKKDGKDGALKNTIASIEGSLPSVQSMVRGLKSQNRYMREYQFLLEQAKSMGLSEGLLSQFSDGSQESYDYLTAIVRSSESEIEELNAAYAENEAQRGKFTDSLTQTRLEADDQFQQLVQDAKDAVDGLNLEEEAYESVASLVSGIVAALRENRTTIATEVDTILGILGRLASANYGASISSAGWVGTFGARITPHADGLNYVPYDGYLASLHEGESILTAQEAKVWRNFKSGQQDSRNTIDYGRLSSAIWDNAPSMGGGNVYLDGQTVGRVISARQADSYRSLQRSGWSA